MGDYAQTVRDRLDTLVCHRYTPQVSFLSATSVTGLALWTPTMPQLSEFETHLVIGIAILVLYFVFFCSFWMRTMVLPLPKRPPRTGPLSLAGAAVLLGPPTYAANLLETVPLGLGIVLVGAAVLAHETVGWLRHQ